MRRLFIIATSLLTVFFTAQAAEAPAAATTDKPFTLNTNAFLDKGLMPVLYSCNGKNISPQLDWTNVPAKTKSFAIILSDKDAPGGIFYHWILYNIPASTTSLAEGEQKLPSGAELATNSFDKQQYNGPCPPKDATHTYIFQLYALDDKLTVPANADAKVILNAMQKHIVGTSKLTAIYTRWLN